MTAKEYLKHLRKLDIVINQKLKELSDLRALSRSIGSIDYSKERVQTSFTASKSSFVEVIERIDKLDTEINREIDRFVDEKHKIINQIQGLQNSNYIDILHKRYVEFKSFEVIAMEMNFTYQYTVELHGKALIAFKTTYENL